MDMRKYSDCDYLHISNWFIKRNLKPPSPALLPKHGVVVHDTAVGFLITTDAGVGILDFFVSNPEKEQSLRIEALDAITTALTYTAQNLGILTLICNTNFANIKALADRHRFNYLGEYSSFSKEISGG